MAEDSDEAPEMERGSKRPRNRSKRDEDDDDGDDSAPEDPFYMAAAQQAKARKKQRGEMFAPAPTRPPLAEAETEGPRKVSRAVEKNRGLTPHRRRDIKNPRVKGRKRFESATKRRRGQVQDVRRPSGGGYGGEATGIKSRVSKSTRFS